MPRLDERLKIVARQIYSETHVDIGSDHGHLLVALLAAGRIQRGIAIENKQLPWENSFRSLRGLSADVRFADGLAGLAENEADSLSICGLGGKTIVQILTSFPSRIPSQVIAQPNNREDLVREWGMQSGFHLVREFQTSCSSHFVVLCFERSFAAVDPAYDGLPLEESLFFGPHLLRESSVDFHSRLLEERDYLRSFPRLQGIGRKRLMAIERVLAFKSIENAD